MVLLKKPKHIKTPPANLKLSKSISSDEFKVILSYYREAIYKKNKKDNEVLDDIHLKSMNFISPSNECEVWQMLELTLKEQLQAYKTTIKAD